MTQSIHRTQSARPPSIQISESQPVGIRSFSSEINQVTQKKQSPLLRFQKLNVTDDFVNDFINETDIKTSDDSNNSIKVSDISIKSNKNSTHFDEICEIDQIAILPFFPIAFNH